MLGDIILSLDGTKVKNGSDLYKALDKKQVGHRILTGIHWFLSW